MPPKPSAAASRSVSTGKIFSASQRAASGSMRAVANCRAVSRNACCSSVRLKSMRAGSYRGGTPRQPSRMATNGPSPYARNMGWRDMTAEEVATLPEARLGGALLWMVAAAALLCIVAIAGALFTFHQLREIGGRYMIAVGFVAAWSFAFIVLTLLRARVTPVVAGAGLVIWIAYRFFAVAVSQTGWPLAIDLLGGAGPVAGFSRSFASRGAPHRSLR